ncbi:hypothetical protein R3P38DRAFT_3570970 [Favolaschia claudopus]|uniref:Uncharacterized protein n=1 Tax=Favolaschia claudopus TaxID=2862362 RepID=A0AAW0AQ43_9AGAR
MSSASIFAALAVLENPRVARDHRGSLRYFNSDNQDFADVGCYCAVVQPARTTSTLEVYSQELAPLDYHFFGDILSIIPLGSPDSLNIRTHATVHVCGVPSNIDKPNSTFDIKIEQYLSATKTPDNAFQVHCVFPATPRWEKYKPIPVKGKSVSVEGSLTGFELNDDRSVKHFIVDIEKVTFLGNASSTTPKAEESPTKIGMYVFGLSSSCNPMKSLAVNTGTPARLKFTGFLYQHFRIRRSASLTNKRMSLKTRSRQITRSVARVTAS